MAARIGNPLSVEEIQECLDAGMTLDQMATKFNRSRTNIHYWLQRYGLKPAVRPTKLKPCAKCGQPVPKLYRKFCQECYESRVYNPKANKTLAEAQTPKLRKRLLVEKRGQRCEECGLDTWNGQQIVVEMHHVDGNSDNNDESNLKLLCPNCHSLTPTYRAANIGNGSKRSEYRKRYYYRTEE